MAEEKRNRRKIIVGILLVLVICLGAFTLVFALTMFVHVSVGHAAILVDPWAKTISEPTIGPAWMIKAPWVQAVDIIVATDTLGMWGDGTDKTADFPTVLCFSRDQLEMAIDIMLRWRLDVSKLKQLYESLPQKNWKNDVIASVAREQIRIVTKDFDAIHTIEQREQVAQSIRDAIWNKLSGEPSLAGAITSFEFELRNIGYPPNYTAAIEDKLVKEQQKLGAEFERERIVILANATAQQVLIEANAEAQAKVLVANGTKEAIDLILSSGGNTLNSTRIAELYLWVEALKQIAPNIDILIMTPEGTPILIPAPTP